MRKAADIPIIVTGATGWMGRATLAFLQESLGSEGFGRVYPFSSCGRILDLRGRLITCRPLAELALLAPKPYLLLHFAFLTKEKLDTMTVGEFEAENDRIGDLVAMQARRLGVRGIFLPSSGAVYGDDPYGAMKRCDEERFTSLAQAEGMRLGVGRIFNLAGPYINKIERYALASIIQDIQQGGPIRLRADHEVWRSYVHVQDVARLAVAMLSGEKNLPEAPFDMAGQDVVEIGELARRAAGLLGHPGTVIERPALVGSEDRYVGDGTRMAGLMQDYGYTPVGLDQQIRDTAQWLAGDRR